MTQDNKKHVWDNLLESIDDSIRTRTAHLSQRQKIGLSVLSCEAIGMGGAFGALALANQLIPGRLKFIKDTISKKVIEPHIEMFRPLYDLSMLMKGKDDDLNLDMLTNRAKADVIADTLISFSIPAVAGFAATIAAHKVVDKPLDVDQEKGTSTYIKARTFEGVVQVGLTALINLAGNKQIEGASNVMTKILHKCGMDKKQARVFSEYALRYEVPNLAAIVPTIFYLDHQLNANKASPGRN